MEVEEIPLGHVVLGVRDDRRLVAYGVASGERWLCDVSNTKIEFLYEI